MDKIITILATIWTQLFKFVDMFLASLANMSLQDLLTWMIVIIVIMVVALAVLNATYSLVNHSLTIIRRLFRYFTVLVGILIVVFWVFAAERPCMFDAESVLTSCLNKEEQAKRQQDLR